MAESFDPYHRWLSIPPEEQPPNHYRLLGVKLFEDNLDVIESASDRQMAHLRTFQGGRHSELSQRLLNEVATAKVVLLNQEKKAKYDAQLRQEMESARPVQAAEESPWNAPDIESSVAVRAIAASRSRRLVSGGWPARQLGILLGAGTLGLIVVALLISNRGRGPEASGQARRAETSPRATADNRATEERKTSAVTTKAPAQGSTTADLPGPASGSAPVPAASINAIPRPTVEKTGASDQPLARAEKPAAIEAEPTRAPPPVDEGRHDDGQASSRAAEAPPEPSQPDTTKDEPEPKQIVSEPGRAKLLGQGKGKANLIELISLRPAGDWKIENGVLISPETLSHVVIPYVPPREYVLKAVVERAKGSDMLSFLLRSGNSLFEVVLDASGGKVSGLNMIDGKDVHSNETRWLGGVFAPNRSITITCTVRTGRIVVAVNGRAIISWKGDFRRLSITPEQAETIGQGIGIICWKTSFRLREMEITPITGRGHVLTEGAER